MATIMKLRPATRLVVHAMGSARSMGRKGIDRKVKLAPVGGSTQSQWRREASVRTALLTHQNIHKKGTSSPPSPGYEN